MTKQTAISPQVYARAGGVLYLITIVFGAFDEGFIADKLIIAGDPAATAHNIIAQPVLWTLGAAGNLIVPVIAVVGVWISYVLLRPVSRSLIVLDVLFSLVSLAVESVSKLFLLLTLPILASSEYAKAFDAEQIQALANLALKAHGITFNIALIFFGLSCLVEGYLIYKSGYFPKFIGILLQLAGLCYLIACFSALFYPVFAAMITPAILLPVLVGESAYCLWLLIKGVNLAKWNERQLSMES